jgi:hypothetical protein
MKKPILFLSLIFPFLLIGQDTYDVFFLGGQSNMDGFGYNRDLPPTLQKEVDQVMIFHGNPAPDGAENGGLGIWSRLEPGHGFGFQSDGETNQLGDRFGLSLTFVQTLLERNPDRKIALIQYSRGGTSIDSMAAEKFGSWEPDVKGPANPNQYDHFLKTITTAYQQTDINGDGQPDRLIPKGILWMQGESDASTEAVARRYEANLKRLIDLIRAAFREDDLPVVIGKISDSYNLNGDKVWAYGELVQYAQEAFVRKDSRAAIVRSTRNYRYSDPYHYDSEGYLDLGRRFAESLLALEK